jgi:adenylate cyclase
MKKPIRSPLRLGFRTSIIGLFLAIVLVVGLSLVYLSFNRVGTLTRSAAASFLDAVAQLSADRIDARFSAVKDRLEILQGLPSVESGSILNDPRLNALLASMLRNNTQLFNLYVGYDDGTFIEMDLIDRAGPEARRRFGAPEDAKFRLVVITRFKDTTLSSITFLSDTFVILSELPGPERYDPRERPWYKGAHEPNAGLLTDPYIFFATGAPGYTLRMPLSGDRRGVVAGDVLLGEAEEMLRRQQLGRSGVIVVFDDAGHVLAHPDMSHLLAPDLKGGEIGELPRLGAIDGIGISNAVGRWRAGGGAQQFFRDPQGRVYAAAFRSVETPGSAHLNLGVFAPVDEFYSEIEAERRNLFIIALGFVLAALPPVFWIGSMLSRRLKALAAETDSIQRFELSDAPQLHSVIREIDDLGRSVFTMRTLIRTFSLFVPRRLVQQLVQTGTAMTLGGSRRELTILFTDVVNFTGITENADPTRVMLYTSRYFSALSGAVMAARGTIDKFIGDAVMAFWNAPVDDPDHAANACAGALALMRANDGLNTEFEREGWPAYRTRCGLHCGEAVVGNIGSEDRMNYTALGATVNLAARLEGLNKNYGTSILVSATLRRRAGSEFVFRSVDRISPKGFAEAFEIYELKCERGNCDAEVLELCREWEIVYAALRNGPLMVAENELAAFLAKYPQDGVARYHRMCRTSDCEKVATKGAA